MTARQRDTTAGFTLAETLVALALVGLISTLLFEAARFAGRARAARTETFKAVAALTAAETVLRSVVSAQRRAPDLPILTGTGTDISLTTTADLPGVPPGAKAVRLRIDDSRLVIDWRDPVMTEEWEGTLSVAAPIGEWHLTYEDGALMWEGGPPPALVEVQLTSGPIDWWPVVAVAPGLAALAD